MTPTTTTTTTTSTISTATLPPLPAPVLLRHVVQALGSALRGEMGAMLAAPRFEAGAAALARLAAPAHLDAAVRALPPDEAAWFAAQLLARWAALGPVALPPAVAILGPEEVLASEQPGPIPLALAAHGLLPGWTARWHGADAAPDGATATVALPVPAAPADAPAPVTIAVRVHVHGRDEKTDARCALIAETTIRVRG